MADLLNVDVALERILAQIERVGSETIHISEALNRVLAEDVASPIDLPRFDYSAMDGYAVHAADVKAATQDNPIRVQVVSDVKAGESPEDVVQSGQAARIMTGAPIPHHTDAVVPVELTDGGWDKSAEEVLPTSVAVYKPVEAGAHIRRAGEEVQHGQVLVTAGTPMRPQEIGMLVAVGQAQVSVMRRPRVVVLATGDELVPVEDELTPGKIHDTNSYTMANMARQYGADVITLPIAPDEPEAVRYLFEDALEQEPDMILTSGGVSVGAADYIRDILQEMGEVGFWRINLRPGKPFAFGTLRDVPFFGLPGNPVSVMVTFEVMVRPALLKLAGRPDDWFTQPAMLSEDIKSDGRRTFVRVKLTWHNDQLYASSTGTQSSGALVSMVLADGLLILPEGVTEAKAGESYPVRVQRWPIA